MGFIFNSRLYFCQGWSQNVRWNQKQTQNDVNENFIYSDNKVYNC